MKKVKSLVSIFMLVLVLIVGSSMAYFSDVESKTNLVTLGDNIDITLSETWNSQDGLGLHPGAVVTKAPQINNVSLTTSAYVFAEVIVPCYATTGSTVDAPLFTYTVNNGWTLINTPVVNTTDKTITYVYAYGTSSTMTELQANTSTNTVFDTVTLAPTLTQTQKNTANASPNIEVNAYGIQTENMTGKTPAQIFALFGSNN